MTIKEELTAAEAKDIADKFMQSLDGKDLEDVSVIVTICMLSIRESLLKSGNIAEWEVQKEYWINDVLGSEKNHKNMKEGEA